MVPVHGPWRVDGAPLIIASTAPGSAKGDPRPSMRPKVPFARNPARAAGVVATFSHPGAEEVVDGVTPLLQARGLLDRRDAG